MADLKITKITRRSALKLAGASMIGSSALAAAGCSSSARIIQADESSESPNLFSPPVRATIAAVQEHFLPSELESPGARELNAIGYLELALTGSDVDPNDVTQIIKGAGALDGMSLWEMGMSFIALNSTEKERLLRHFESTDAGAAWLTLLMSYTLEAFMGDPAYGGNTDELGWRSVGHHPGVPRPIKISAGNRR